MGLDVTGSGVLTEIFDNVTDETPEIEASADEIPAEETPSLEEAPGEESPPENTEDTEKPENTEDTEKPEKADSEEEEEEENTDKVPDGFVPIPVHAELRAKARDKENDLRQRLTDAQIAQAKAEARAELLEQMASKAEQPPPPAPEKSPLEQFEEDYPGEAVTATVLLEQKKWDQAQEEQQTAQTRMQTQEQQVVEGVAEARDMYSAEKTGSEELTLDSVVALARNHGVITQEDVANLAPYGKRAGIVLYSLATSAIKQAGGAPLQELNRRVISARQASAAKNEQTKKPKPPASPDVPAAPVGNKPKVDEDDADVDGITSFIFS